MYANPLLAPRYEILLKGSFRQSLELCACTCIKTVEVCHIRQIDSCHMCAAQEMMNIFFQKITN